MFWNSTILSQGGCIEPTKQNLGGSGVGIRNLLLNLWGWPLLRFLNKIVDKDLVTKKEPLDIWCVVG